MTATVIEQTAVCECNKYIGESVVLPEQGFFIQSPRVGLLRKLQICNTLDVDANKESLPV